MAVLIEKEDTRSRVMAYMYWYGEDHWRLTETQWKRLYLLADGFGRVTRDWARHNCWDWSHVRDSSPGALERIWKAICSLHNRGRLKTTQDLEVQHGIN